MKKQLKRLSLVAGLAFAGLAAAQPYPSKPVHLIVGFTAGGGTDVAARLVAEPMGKVLGQPVIVENRPGAAGMVGARYVLSQPADGYTIHFGIVNSFTSVFVKDNPLDPARDFDPITNIESGGLLFVVRGDLPVNTLRELIEYSKANPGKLNAATAPGSASDLLYAVLKDRTKMEFTLLPYQGDAPSITALLGGVIDVSQANISLALPHIKAGKLKAVFYAAERRSSLLPDVPTAAQAGAPGALNQFNLGLWARKGTPREVIQKLNAAGHAALKTEAVIETFRKFGVDPVGTTPEDQLRIFEAEAKANAEAARLGGMQPR